MESNNLLEKLKNCRKNTNSYTQFINNSISFIKEEKNLDYECEREFLLLSYGLSSNSLNGMIELLPYLKRPSNEAIIECLIAFEELYVYSCNPGKFAFFARYILNIPDLPYKVLDRLYWSSTSNQSMKGMIEKHPNYSLAKVILYNLTDCVAA